MSVEIENLTVETDSGFCLRIPYLSVEKGGIRAIAGPSGSGKSLLFETVAGFHCPLSGCIRIGGREVTGQPAERRKVAMIFQEDALFPHLTVLQNVSFAVGRDGRARQWLARAGMEEYGALYPSQLNAYERRRVDFLRALAADAEVILMDEPTAGLPPERKEAWRQFAWEWLKETGRTALVATADVEEAVGWSQQMAVLWNGRLIQEGTAAELFQRPLTPEVVAVTGGGRVFRGQIAKRRDSWTVVRVFSGNGSVDLTVWSRWFYREWEDVWVYIPEVALRVWPRREAEAVGSPNRFPGTVAEIQSHRYGMSVRVESPPLNLTAFVQQQDWEGLRLQHGDPVWLSVDPHGLHLMPVRQ